MVSLFYRQPRLLALTVLLVLVAGFSALQVLPRREDPELVTRNALIVTPYPGASAGRVETQVTEKIEEELEEIEEVQKLESTSQAGVSLVTVELLDSVQDPDEVWSRVRDRLDDATAELPAGAGEPEFDELTITAYTIIAGLAWERDEPANLAILSRLAEELEDRLRTLPGTDSTEVFGDPEEEIRVDVAPSRIASLGLDAGDIASELEAGDSKVSAGRLRSPLSELLIEVEGEVDTLARVASIPIVTGDDGTIVRLGEIADVSRTVSDPPSELARVGDHAGVLVAVRMRSGMRVDDFGQDVRDALDEFRERLPAGVELSLVFDQSEYTSERFDELFANLALGAVLVVGVILLSMGWRSALLVASALPLSALMVFTGMNLLGIPLHQMSITGLIIALGLLIDNAIVMVDEVRHRLGHGPRSVAEASRAVGSAVRALAIPLLASTFTTVLAFLPLVLAPGPVGEFVGAMSVSVILAVVSSLFLSLTVLPALTGMVERRGGSERGPAWLRHGLSSARLTAVYRKLLRVAFARPIVGVLVAVTLPVLGFALGGTLQEQFFPPAGRDQVRVELRLADVAAIDRTSVEVERATEVLRRHPKVVDAHWAIGGSIPKYYYNMLENERSSPNYAEALVQLTTGDDVVTTIRELQDALDSSLPGSQALVRQLEQGPPFEAPVELILAGPDLDALRALGEELRRTIAGVPNVVHTSASLAAGRPKLLFRPSDEELERAGWDRVGVARQLQGALDGALGGSLIEAGEELALRVRVGAEERASADRIASLELAAPFDGRTASGAPEAASWTPLGSLGQLDLVPEAAAIPRREGQRTNEVRAYITAGTLAGDVLDEVRAHIADIELPAGTTLTFGGESAERDKAVGNLAASVGPLATLMLATLVLAFRSFRAAGIISLVAALAVGLALGSLWLFGHPFGFMAIVGALGLIGIAINDAIVVLAALHDDEGAAGGDVEATVEVVVRSTRHVVSTTVTTIAGFTPLLLETAGLWPPLAVSIAGGVGGATLLALTLVPALFRMTRWRAQAEAASTGSEAPQSPSLTVAPA